MPRQSTRHNYRSRREKNALTARYARLVGLGVLIFLLGMLLYNGRDLYHYYVTYFNDL